MADHYFELGCFNYVNMLLQTHIYNVAYILLLPLMWWIFEDSQRKCSCKWICSHLLLVIKPNQCFISFKHILIYSYYYVPPNLMMHCISNNKLFQLCYPVICCDIWKYNCKFSTISRNNLVNFEKINHKNPLDDHFVKYLSCKGMKLRNFLTINKHYQDEYIEELSIDMLIEWLRSYVYRILSGKVFVCLLNPKYMLS